ncbi:hypothetical protein C1X78_26285, partial [Pseudomonas sp. MPR-R1B]
MPRLHIRHVIEIHERDDDPLHSDQFGISDEALNFSYDAHKDNDTLFATYELRTVADVMPEKVSAHLAARAQIAEHT